VIESNATPSAFEPDIRSSWMERLRFARTATPAASCRATTQWRQCWQFPRRRRPIKLMWTKKLPRFGQNESVLRALPLCCAALRASGTSRWLSPLALVEPGWFPIPLQLAPEPTLPPAAATVGSLAAEVEGWRGMRRLSPATGPSSEPQAAELRTLSAAVSF